MEKIKDFKQLKIWQKGIEIVKDVYEITKKFPKEELYGLTSKVRRSAISIPSNIAEGFKRFSRKENKQFLHIALGSSAEMETQLVIAKELGFIKESDLTIITAKLEHLSKMITSLRKKME
jgi:four helix bundle protein